MVSESRTLGALSVVLNHRLTEHYHRIATLEQTIQELKRDNHELKGLLSVSRYGHEYGATHHTGQAALGTRVVPYHAPDTLVTAYEHYNRYQIEDLERYGSQKLGSETMRLIDGDHVRLISMILYIEHSERI